jgi:hypothetical protein
MAVLATWLDCESPVEANRSEDLLPSRVRSFGSSGLTNSAVIGSERFGLEKLGETGTGRLIKND